MSCVACHILFSSDKVVQLCGGGFVINGANLVQFLSDLIVDWEKLNSRLSLIDVMTDSM